MLTELLISETHAAIVFFVHHLIRIGHCLDSVHSWGWYIQTTV